MPRPQILEGVFDRFLHHFLHLSIVHIHRGFHLHDFLSAGLHIARQDVENAIRIDFKLHAYARDPFRRRVEIEDESAEAPVVCRPVALALQNMNEHAALMVHRSGEHFAGLQGDRGVARNNDVHQAAERFDAERQRRHVEQQHVLEAARKNFRLNRRAQRDRFVGILRRVEQRAYRLAAIRPHSDVLARF